MLYATDDSAFERVLPAARLPGVESPVYAVASPSGFGWVAASATHAALAVYALRKAFRDVFGELSIRAFWATAGIETRGDPAVHRKGLAPAREGGILVSGGSVVSEAGKMLRSAPPFAASEEDGRWPWEESELLVRLVELDPLEGGE